MARGRTNTIPRLGTGGRRTDVPTWALRPDELADGSQDGIVYEGAVRRRRGARVHSSFSPLGTLDGVYRCVFPYTRRKATIVTSSTGGTSSIYDDGNLVFQYTNADETVTRFLPRVMFGGELLLMAEGGIVELRRYAGADPTLGGAAGTTPATVAGQAIVNFATAHSFARGHYIAYTADPIAAGNNDPIKWVRVAETPTATQITMDGAIAVAARAPTTPGFKTGLSYPCITVLSTGTVSATGVSPTTITATGSNFPQLRYSTASEFPGLYVNPRNYRVNGTTYTGNSFSTESAAFTNQPFLWNRRMPVIDGCVHNDVLYTAGVRQFPNRVYISPTGWDMTYAPGAILPYQIESDFTGPASSFVLDFVDVPTENDGDPIVALLATDSPRLVLKQNSVWALYGEPPNLDPRPVHIGDGCIDIRSAISVSEGAFWAGSDGIYRYRFGDFDELTKGWMRNEWRALTNAGIEFCALGVDGRHLIVSIGTADAAHQRRTYAYDLDLGRWLPELTNIHPRHMFSANITGEIQQLLCVDDAYPGKVVNLRPALDNSGPARDEVGVGPNFRLVTGDALVSGGGIDGEGRILDVAVHANVRDSGGTTLVNVRVTHGGSLRGDGAVLYGGGLFGGFLYGPDGGKNLGDITSDTDDDVKRYEFDVNRMGRRATLILEETTASTTVDVVEVGEATVAVRDARRGT